MEAEQVEIWHVINDSDEAALQVFGVAEVDEFASVSCAMDSAVFVEPVAGGDKGHGCKRSGGASMLMQSSTCLL